MISGISIISGQKASSDLSEILSPKYVEEVIRFHRSMPMYQKTPLVALPGLAKKLGFVLIERC